MRRPRQAVLRPAVAAGAVVDDHLGDAHPLLARDGGDEPVHLAVEAQRLDHLGLEDLERATVVAQPHPGDPRDQQVGDAGDEPAGDPGVAARLAPAADDVEPLAQLVDHPRNLAEIVLQVAVRGRDQASPGGREPGRERRRLTEVAAQADHPHPGVRRLQPGEPLEGAVGAAVVDEHHLVGAPPGVEGLGELGVERVDVRRLVQEGNDDRQLRQPVVKIPAGFERRCIPPACVARRLHMPDTRPSSRLVGHGRSSARRRPRRPPAPAGRGATRNSTAGCRTHRACGWRKRLGGIIAGCVSAPGVVRAW